PAGGGDRFGTGAGAAHQGHRGGGRGDGLDVRDGGCGGGGVAGVTSMRAIPDAVLFVATSWVLFGSPLFQFESTPHHPVWLLRVVWWVAFCFWVICFFCTIVNVG